MSEEYCPRCKRPLRISVCGECNADDMITLATLCDLVLGEEAEDRSNKALIRGVSALIGVKMIVEEKEKNK